MTNKTKYLLGVIASGIAIILLCMYAFGAGPVLWVASIIVAFAIAVHFIQKYLDEETK